MTYPLSSDVTDGQPTAYQHYNNLRADALRFSQAAADAVNLGTGLIRYSDNLVLEPLATNRVRVPYSAIRPPTLMIDGCLCQATADVDLASSTFSGAAATWYIFANRAAGATTFSLTANTSLSESAGQRRIAMIYWDGSNLSYPTLFVYPPGRPGLYYARVSRTAAQSIANTTWTAVSFDTEEADTDTLYAGAAPTRITIVHPGVYLLAANFNAVANYGRGLAIKLNGTTELASESSFIGSGGLADARVSCSTVRHLAAGDYLEMFVWQNAGSAQNTQAPTNLAVAALSA